MQSTKTYSTQLRALLSPAEHRVFRKLSTPQKVQLYLDAVPINFELSGETLYSPRQLVRENKAHCIEAAMFAAASLSYHGYPPLLMDFQTTPNDEDHVIAIFKVGKYWGAISKTNHATLRWRDPVYTSVRELAMSYFHEYILPNGKKTMLAYSAPFDLRRYIPERWVTAEGKQDFVAEDLDASRHFPAVRKSQKKQLLNAAPIERTLLEHPEEWTKGGKRLH